VNTQRMADNLFDRCKAQGLVNPITGDGSPTREMVVAELDHASDGAEMDNLAMLTRRLVFVLRKRDPDNLLCKQAVEFLVCIGQAGSILRKRTASAKEDTKP